MKNIALVFSLLWINLLAATEPFALYLTWQKAPESTMTIQWITPKNQEHKNQQPKEQELSQESSLIQFQKTGDLFWKSIEGTHRDLPQDVPYVIHIVQLCGLHPNSSYYFRIGQDEKKYQFRTMPKELDEPIVFVVGGDTNQIGLKIFAETNRFAASQEPWFALLGGDLAYAASSDAKGKENSSRWLQWIETYSKTMVTPTGYLIPLIVAIGNHDVCGDYNQTPREALFFYSLFAMPGLPGYNALRFGNYMSLYILDSGHTNPIEGAQSHWLDKELDQDQELPILHRFALYHVPAFPSVREFRSKTSALIRTHWVPLFEQYGLHVAFENHDHAYKRTYPLRKGKIDPTGVIYLGDGSWGVEPRIPKKPKRVAYLAKTKAVRQFIKVQITKNTREFWALDSRNSSCIDHYVQHVNRQIDLIEELQK